MRLARFQYGTEIAIGSVDAEAGTITGIAIDRAAHDPMIALIEAQTAGHRFESDGSSYPLAEVRLLPPVARPGKNILCVGKNYREHAQEFARSGYDASTPAAADPIPAAPIIFSKAPCTMTGAADDIVPPWSITDKVDYEGELGVVIGAGGRAISTDDAYSRVFGYTVINDVTARDLQAAHKQWLLGKSIDTFCPIGPWIVTADAIDPENLELRCWVNGELRQQANTRDLIFDIPSIIATVSASMTLSPGDIIATGTPAGVGIGFDPPKFLHQGDSVRVSISGIGEIENKVV